MSAAPIPGATSLPGSVPAHLEAAQLLVNRCPSPELKKSLIVAIACHDAITAEDGELLIQANHLETA